jgi:hypothetical protein
MISYLTFTQVETRDDVTATILSSRPTHPRSTKHVNLPGPHRSLTVDRDLFSTRASQDGSWKAKEQSEEARYAHAKVHPTRDATYAATYTHRSTGAGTTRRTPRTAVQHHREQYEHDRRARRHRGWLRRAGGPRGPVRHDIWRALVYARVGLGDCITTHAW